MAKLVYVCIALSGFFLPASVGLMLLELSEHQAGLACVDAWSFGANCVTLPVLIICFARADYLFRENA